MHCTCKVNISSSFDIFLKTSNISSFKIRNVLWKFHKSLHFVIMTHFNQLVNLVNFTWFVETRLFIIWKTYLLKHLGAYFLNINTFENLFNISEIHFPSFTIKYLWAHMLPSLKTWAPHYYALPMTINFYTYLELWLWQQNCNKQKKKKDFSNSSK